MGDVAAVATAVTSIADLVHGILERSDRDAPDNEFNANITTIQNAFADNQLDSDGFRLFIDKLCNAAGTPLTPTQDPGIGRRELLHSLLVAATKLIYERQLAARALAKLTHT